MPTKAQIKRNFYFKKAEGYESGPTIPATDFRDRRQEMYAYKAPDQLEELHENPLLHACWKTQDGRMLEYRQMSNSHLFNAIRYLARKDMRCKGLEAEVLKRLGQVEATKPGIFATEATKPLLRNIIRSK